MILGSQVETVGRHLQLAGQPCLNWSLMCTSAPRGVIVLLPVINRYSFDNGFSAKS